MLDLSRLDNLKKHLSRYGLYAKKTFGQNFLIDDRILDAIIEAGDIATDDHIIEVGPGPGVLSQRIAPHCSQLTAVEIDEQMIAPWKDLMKDFRHVEILQQDVLHYTPPSDIYKVIANIPYYITSPILKHFLRKVGSRRPDRIVLMIQKEVADRICSTKKPTLLSWEITVFGQPEIVCKVPPSAFYPSPKVDSAVLAIDVLPEPRIPEDLLADFFQLLEKSYQQPRKTLSNNLQAAGHTKEQLDHISAQSGLSLRLRPHQLSLNDWMTLLSATSSKDS